MLTITGLQDVTVQFMVATKISQSDSRGTGTGTNERPVWFEGMIDRVICQQFLILCDATTNTLYLNSSSREIHQTHTDMSRVNKEVCCKLSQLRSEDRIIADSLPELLALQDRRSALHISPLSPDPVAPSHSY